MTIACEKTGRGRLSISVAITVIVWIALAGLFAGEPAAARRQVVSLATAFSGGSWHAMGTSLASALSDVLEPSGTRVVAQSTGGGPENIEMLRANEVPFALNYNLIAAQAWAGTGIYMGTRFSGLRTIARLADNVQQPILLEAHVKTGHIRDADGTRFNVGPAGTGSMLEMDIIFRAVGIAPQQEYLSFAAGAQALRDGRIHGSTMSGAIPHPSIVELLSSGVPVRILSITPEDLAAISEIINYASPTVIPANSYPNQPDPIPTITNPLFLCTHDGVDADLVYQVTKALFEKQDWLRENAPLLSDFSLDKALEGLTIPLHPGAYRYYVERGIEVPAALIPADV